ncbi:MAG TPA: FxsA family protein [Actinopolymorphaceae bacterium]
MRPLLLLLALVGAPLLEIYVLIQVGQVIGVWWTVALLLAVSVAGAWLIRREGRRAWRELRGALHQGRLPDKEIIDAGLVLFGGALMLTPGFVSDVLGLVLILPFTRPLARGAVRWAIGRQLARQATVLRSYGAPTTRAPGADEGTGGPVIVGEVLDPDAGRSR